MSERGLGREVEGLRRRIGPALCADPAPCLLSANTELVLRPDGTQQAVGSPPPPLCATCPERESGRPRIRHIEVVLDRRNRHGHERPASAARMPPVGPDEAEQGEATPRTADADDGMPIPPAWRDGHPDAHPDRPRPAPRRRDAPGGPVRVDPSDFGL